MALDVYFVVSKYHFQSEGVSGYPTASLFHMQLIQKQKVNLWTLKHFLY